MIRALPAVFGADDSLVPPPCDKARRRMRVSEPPSVREREDDEPEHHARRDSRGSSRLDERARRARRAVGHQAGTG
jgi:hypothetical protein